MLSTVCLFSLTLLFFIWAMPPRTKIYWNLFLGAHCMAEKDCHQNCVRTISRFNYRLLAT